MTTFELKGNVPSKKNSKNIVYVKGRPLIISSQKHKDWHEEQMWVLKSMKLPSFPGKVKVGMEFFPDTKRRGDLDNKAASVLDLLKDAGVIEDDDWFTVPELVLKLGGVDKGYAHCVVTLEAI